MPPPTNPQTLSPLFRLPPELRLQIYTYVLHSPSPLPSTQTWHQDLEPLVPLPRTLSPKGYFSSEKILNTRPRPPPGLLGACRRCRGEGMEIWMGGEGEDDDGSNEFVVEWMIRGARDAGRIVRYDAKRHGGALENVPGGFRGWMEKREHERNETECWAAEKRRDGEEGRGWERGWRNVTVKAVINSNRQCELRIRVARDGSVNAMLWDVYIDGRVPKAESTGTEVQGWQKALGKGREMERGGGLAWEEVLKIAQMGFEQSGIFDVRLRRRQVAMHLRVVKKAGSCAMFAAMLPLYPLACFVTVLCGRVEPCGNGRRQRAQREAMERARKAQIRAAKREERREARRACFQKWTARLGMIGNKAS